MKISVHVLDSVSSMGCASAGCSTVHGVWKFLQTAMNGEQDPSHARTSHAVGLEYFDKFFECQFVTSVQKRTEVLSQIVGIGSDGVIVVNCLVRYKIVFSPIHFIYLYSFSIKTG